ncbi:MAG: hypothetical protein NTW21_40170 [Verrucomicrobia bacterium]|nr:hypothetical protein [Verrucomicrobiota bacterium]
MKSTNTNEIQTTGDQPVAIKSAGPPRQRVLCLAMAALAGFATPVTAEDVLIAPVAVTALNSWGDRTTSDAIDGGGMTPNNPVTVASTCSTDASTMYLSNGVVQTWITFDLGSSQTLTGFRLWNYNEGGSWSGRGVKDAGIYVGTSMPADGSSYASMGPSWGTVVQDFTFSQATGASGCPGVDYMFTTPVVGRYIQIYVTANFGTADTYTGISEIRFYKPYVPEANILSFGIPPAMPGVISDNSITFYVPTGTDVTSLAPTFIVSRDATCYETDPRLGPAVVINSGDGFDFTNPVHYWVQSADDGVNPVVTNDYTVTATPYSQASSYTWVKATPAGTYNWESPNWDNPGWPDSAGAAVVCNTQSGNNVWNLTSPTITLGSLALGGDGGAVHTISGATSTMIFDNGASHASFSRGPEISTTTPAYINAQTITLNSILDINITSHITSQVSINSSIGGTGGLNVISASGNYPAEGWSGLILNGALTYTGDTVLGDAAWVILNDISSLQFKVTDSGSNKITGTGTIRLNGAINIDTSAVTVDVGNWNLIDVGTLKEYYGASFSINGFTKSGGLWSKTDGSRTWVFNPSTGVLALPAAWITSFTYGSAVGSIDQNARTISLTVPNGTDPATVSPTFTIYSGTCDQTSGSPPSPSFAAQNPATYTVTDSSVGVTRVYTVTLTVAPPAPGGVATGLGLWLDASAASTMTLSGTTVTEWRDKFGGTGKVTATGVPTLVASGIGGIPTVHLNTSSHMNDGVNRAAGPVTIFLVARETGGSNARVLSSASNNWLMAYHGGQYNRFYFEGWVNEGGVTSDTNPRLHAATLDVSADTYTVYANGVQVASNNGGSQGPNNLQLNGSGFGEYSDCDISEVVVYDRVLTGGELNSVGAYLAAKYGLTTSYPGLAEIVSFGVPGYDGVVNQAAKTIVLTVPIGTNLATLAPTFTVFSGTCIDQTSGSPPSPTFAAQNPATYTIRDGAVTNVYTVTVEQYVPPYTWVKTTAPGTYDWESAHWDRAGYPNAAGTAVTCNTQAGTNIWNITSPSITIGSLHLGGDGGANQTLNGAGKTLIFDNGASHASLSRGGDISTTTPAALNFGAITLNSILDINITSHLTSQVSINAPIGGTGGLNVISATGNYPAEGWSGLILNGANTYTGDTVLSAAAWVILNDGGSLKFKVTDSGSNKITGAGTIRLNGAINIDTSAVTLTNGSNASWSLIDVGTLKEYYGTTFTVTGFTKSGNLWLKTAGSRIWVLDTTTGVLSLPAGWITDFRWGSYLGVIDQSAKTISLTVPNLTDLAALNPTFALSSGTCDRTSGSPPVPTFADTNPATYTVTDGATVNPYVVTVVVAPLATGKEMTRLYFPGYGYAWATSATSFRMVVPTAADLNGLAPTYTISWAATGSPASGTPQDFNTAQHYVITAEDGSSTDYTVTVQHATTSGTGSYQQRVLASGPVAYWPLNEPSGTTGYDIASGINNLTYGGTYSLNQTGMRADGNPSVLLASGNTGAPYNPSMNPNYEFSVECWVKPVDAAVQYLVSLQDRTAGGRKGYAIWKNNTNTKFGIQVGIDSAGNTATVNSTTDALAGNVYHVVGTYDGTKFKLYVNGVLEGQVISTLYQPATATQPGFTIGSRNGGTPAPSYMQDVAIYSRALTATEIQTHYLNPPATLTYADWAATKYPTADLTDPTADLDRDGMSNFGEYAFGLNPTTGSSVNPNIVPLDKGTHQFRYTRTENTGLAYTVWTSADLQAWNGPAAVTETVVGTPSEGVETVEVTLSAPPAGDELFVRVQAE